jgi:hypothetical protein
MGANRVPHPGSGLKESELFQNEFFAETFVCD